MTAEHGGNAKRAQHDGGMAIGPALLRRHTGDPRRVEQGRIGWGDVLGDQDCPLRHVLQRAEGRGGEGADQPAANFAHLAGAAQQAGLVVILRRQDEGGDLLRFVQHRGFGAQAGIADAFAGAAQQAGIAQHKDIGIEQGREFLLRLLGQDVQPGLELGDLFARGGGGLVQLLSLALNLGRGDDTAGHIGWHLAGVMDRAYGDAGRNGNAAKDRFLGRFFEARLGLSLH